MKKVKRTMEQIRLESEQKLKEKLMLIEQEQGADCAAHYHRILIEKIPYASKIDDWFGCRPEWDLIGFTLEKNNDNAWHGTCDEQHVIIFPNPITKNVKPITVNREIFLALFNQSDYFNYENLPQDSFAYPHLDDWNSCVCTHHIERVFIIRNKVNGHLTRIGSECIHQFADLQMVNLADKLGSLTICKCCDDLFLSRELNRVYPKKGLQKKAKSVLQVTKDRHTCYICSVKPKKLCIYKRCPLCPLLIKKTDVQCSGRCFYDDISTQ
jgi:hypothetical protein